MKGLNGMFGGKRVFAGKKRLHEEPFCPFTTDEPGFHALRRKRNTAAYNSNGLQNTGSFGPVTDIHQKYPNKRRF